MRPRIVIRSAADAELDEQAAYLAEDNPDAALRFLEAARQTMADLAETPAIGRLWGSPNQALAGVRVWRIKGFENWLLFYRSAGDGIEVLHFFHGARDLTPLLESENG